ncbi:AAA family ATPase [Stetteria hydrogenophila]
MLVRSVDVKDFRGVRGLSEPLELSNFTVLLGRNNVGKTAILEALYLLAMPFPYPIPPYRNAPLRVVADLHDGHSSLIYGYTGEAKVFLQLAKRADIKGVGISGVSIAIREKEVDVYYHGKARTIRFGGLADYASFLKSCGCGIERDLAALYVPDNSSYYAKLGEFILEKEDVLRWIEKQGLHAKAARIVSEAVYDKFTEVLARRDRLALRKEAGSGVGPLYVDVNSLGVGVRRLLLVYLAVEYLNPRIILWDDVEVAMHPDLLEAVVRWLSGSGRQVVVSTHSIDLLYALTLEKPRDARVVVLRKRGDDIVEHKSLDIDEVEELVERGVDPRRIVDELEM